MCPRSHINMKHRIEHISKITERLGILGPIHIISWAVLMRFVEEHVDLYIKHLTSTDLRRALSTF